MDSDNFPPDGIPDTKRCRRKSAFLTQSIRAERAIEDAEDKLRALPLNAFMEQYGEQIEELWAKRACTKPPTGSLPSLRPNTNLRRSGWNSRFGISTRHGHGRSRWLCLYPLQSARRSGVSVRPLPGMIAGWRRCSLNSAGPSVLRRRESAPREARRYRARRWSGDKRHLPKSALPQETAVLWNQPQPGD